MEYLRDIAKRLRTCTHGAAGELLQSASAHLGVSRQTLYRRLRRVGWTSHRKLRADRGDSRVSVEEVRSVAGILKASQRQTDKELLPTGDAIEMALSNGLLKTRVSQSTMLRLMRLHDCHPRQLARPDPHVAMRSLHPNHVWEIDASVCVLYYLHNGRMGVMDERRFNVRKPANLAKVSRERVLRWVCTDHCSGDVIARYYNVAGEDQQTLFEFLMFCMQQHPDRVMHGVPWMLVWDAGSANTSHAIKSLLDALQVRYWNHVPGNPRAKGQVEGTNNVIERKFEGRLIFTRIDSVEQLNAELDTWLKAFNGSYQHSRTRTTRDALWQTIRQEQLRLCPPVDVCRAQMYARPEYRTVTGNLLISYAPKGHESAMYSVEAVPNVRAGEKVRVTVNLYRAPNIVVIGEDKDGQTHYVECEPIAKDSNGFFTNAPAFGVDYASTRDTAVDTARKDLDEAAYGKRDRLEAIAARNGGRIAFDGKIDPFKDLREAAANVPAHMVRRGTELDVPDPVHIELKPLDFITASKELRARLDRRITPDEQESIRAWYPDGIPETELDAVAARLRNPVPPRPLLSVVGGTAA